MTPGDRFHAAAGRVVAVDDAAAAAAVERHLRLTKPPGSLGAVEAIGARLAAIAGTCPPPVPSPATVAVFAGDHGVLRRGVSPWPQEITAAMVANLATGGAAVNVLARQVGATVVVVDVGVATPLPSGLDGVVRRRVRDGTADLASEPAMTRDDALAALDVGVEVAERCLADGARALVTGDMGIANTTPSAAVIAALTGRDPGDVTGRGTGIDDERLRVKVDAVRAGLDRLRDDSDGDVDPLRVLTEVGGLEIAALAGFVVAGAAARVPVVVDGVIAAAGLLVAVGLVPAVRDYVIAGHRSVEPGASVVLDDLGLAPVLDLGMRLGEGTGAVLALPVVQAAARVLSEMATFDDLALGQ